MKRENGGQVVTGFLQRACCSRRYSVMMLSRAGGEGRCLSGCFFMAGVWLKAPWSDFCRSTLGFLLLPLLRQGEGRSRVKTMRPIRGEPLLCGGGAAGGGAGREAGGCEVDGRG